MVFDMGLVDSAAARASGGRLVEGQPWLVMERASGGTLASLPRLPSWARLRRLMVLLLDGLGHAHARGIIHRDLKPANVLVCTRADARPGIKLADFGIAWAMGSGVDADLRAGTPRFMAPEQLLGTWRDYGPWTDLYALGCLGWKLATGRAPFAHKRGIEQIHAHLERDPPPFEGRPGLPGGLEAWLRRLLRKQPSQRYACAADAASALLSLCPEATESSPGSEMRPHDYPTWGSPATAPWDWSEPAATPPDPRVFGLPTVELKLTAVPVASKPSLLPESFRAPLPCTWERPEIPLPAVRLVSAGLSLYGLREAPLAGRRAECDALWMALREADSSQDWQLVSIRGPTGIGKSRLVQYLSRRAQELGAAEVVQVSHGAGDAPMAPLREAVRRVTRCHGLEGAELQERIGSSLLDLGVTDPGDVSALASFCSTIASVPAPRERLAVLTCLLGALSRQRPVVLWLDDAQWGEGTLDLTEKLICGQGFPVVVILTIRDEALPEQPRAAAALARIEAHPAAQTLCLDPLDRAERAALVRGLLALNDRLAAEVETRTGGHPGFAVQLVGSWVQRGLLVVGPDGFELAPGAELQVPDDLHLLWGHRLDSALEGLPLEAEIYLEQAAALGRTVDSEIWHAACEEAEEAVPGRSAHGLSVRRALVDRLARHGLAQEADGGWALGHELLRQAVEQTARDSGRWAWHHRSAAAVLARTQASPAERVAHHLLAAGAPEEALEPLQTAVLDAVLLGEIRWSRVLVERLAGALVAAEIPRTDPRWAFVYERRSEIHRRLGNLGRASKMAKHALAEAEVHGWRSAVVQARLQLARAEMVRGELAVATAHLQEALALEGDPPEDDDTVGRCLVALSMVARAQGNWAEVRQLATRGEYHFARALRPLGAVDCWALLADADLGEGKPEAAVVQLRRVRAFCRDRGNRYGQAGADNSLGDIAREQGQVEEAEALYRQAIAAYEATASNDALFPLLNLGLLRLQLGRFEDARPLLQSGLDVARQTERHTLCRIIHIFLMVCDAAAGDWQAFDRHAAEVGELHDVAREASEISWAALRAAELAAEAGEGERAERARTLAAEVAPFLV